MKQYIQLFLLLFITIPVQEYPTKLHISKRIRQEIKNRQDKEHLAHWR